MVDGSRMTLNHTVIVIAYRRLLLGNNKRVEINRLGSKWFVQIKPRTNICFSVLINQCSGIKTRHCRSSTTASSTTLQYRSAPCRGRIISHHFAGNRLLAKPRLVQTGLHRHCNPDF